MIKIEANNVGLYIPSYGDHDQSIRGQLIKTLSQSKSKITSQGVRVFEGLNFEMKVGDRIALIGQNGAGKSTLLRLIAGIYKPTSGLLKVEGDVKTLLSLNGTLDPNLTGYENIKRMCYLTHFGTPITESMLQHIADFSEIGEFLSMPVRTYSEGMKLRLMSGGVFTNEADIFLVDEYFAVGDKQFADKIKRKMKTLIQNSKIFVLATHSQELVEQYCNRVLLIEGGKVSEITDAYIRK